MKKHLWIKILPVILMLAFIWGHSMMPASASQEESNRFLQQFLAIFSVLQKLLARVGFTVKLSTLVRKCAHITEYAALGVLTALLFRRNRHMRLHWSTLLCLAAAAADEAIQIFSAGRGPGVRDVCIDFCGALFGMGITALICLLIRKTGERRALSRKR